MSLLGGLRTGLAYRLGERRCKKDGHVWLAARDAASGCCIRCGLVTLDRAGLDRRSAPRS